MNPDRLKDLLKQVRSGKVSVEQAMDKMKHLPFEDIDFARIDHHRSLRKGFAEVIFGQGKTVRQIIDIMSRLKKNRENILVTRLDPVKAKAVVKHFPEAEYHPLSRVLTCLTRPVKAQTGRGLILVISAGTSDMPVAEEALLTARIMGNAVEYLYDVGVAGLHRLMANQEKIMSASVLIVVAGMEGALPSVVGGLVDRPVIAVPTSVGYGASFNGLAALLAMLNSCASGVAVVNIDNGFGAGYLATLINRV
ncbi:MAG: nickel pincer cofactor biosynthesis protein LarB [Thermodesulfobacteriota bacterium]